MSTISASTTSTTAYKVTADTTGNLVLQTGSGPTTAVTIDTAQNVGVGVTPSASTLVTIESDFGILAGRTGTNILNNAYYGGSFKYIGANYATRYMQQNGQHVWYTAGSGTAGNAISFTQAMTLDASGQFLVGKTSSAIATVGAELRPGGVVTSTLAGSTNATDTLNVYSTGAGAYRFYVDMGGTIHATSIVISAISDQRLKENVRDIDTGLSSVMALKPRRYDWKDGKGLDKKNAAGFIAQEFEEVFPECVGLSKSGEDGIEYKNINYETLIPTLVKAIQELNAKITALENK